MNGASPAPGAWATLDGDGTKAQRFKIGGAAPVSDPPDQGKAPGEFIIEPHRVLLVCQDGAIELTRVQPSGKKMLVASDWAHGVDPSIGLHTSATHPTEFDVDEG